ncbi:Uncharacterised protein [Mycobacteroides abscessus subsp. abscessus]|nr:Uncharacterised protein [Mycobacteroides abscessus subsp. abscessus]
MPTTTALARYHGSDEVCSANTTSNIPVSRIAQPMSKALAAATRRVRICATQEDPNVRNTLAPATAWLSMPSTPDRNPGATAVKDPSAANPAKPAVAAAAKVARTWGGSERRCIPSFPCFGAVSGTKSSAATAIDTRPM